MKGWLQAIPTARLLVRGFLAFIVLAVVLVLAGENYEYWRGKRDWEKCRADLIAKGEKLDWTDFVPPPVPDEKNLAMTPLVHPLFDFARDPGTGNYTLRNPDAPLCKVTCIIPGVSIPDTTIGKWNTGHGEPLEFWQAYYRKALPGMHLSGSPAGDVLAVLAQYDSTLAELREAVRTHPLCRYPLNYETALSTEQNGVAPFTRLFGVLHLRACAEVAANHMDGALADVHLEFQLAATMRHMPGMVLAVLRVGAMIFSIQPVWDGLASHRWNDAQLAAIEKDLREWDFPDDFDFGMRSERARDNWILDNMRDNPSLVTGVDAPLLKVRSATGWTGPFFKAMMFRNQVLINTVFQEKLLTIMDARAQTINVPRVKEANNIFGSQGRKWYGAPYSVMAALLLPAGTVAKFFAMVQNDLNEEVIACEIERYRIAHGRLPATLDELHAANLPHDIINGQPMRYRVTGDDSYLLYSVGWNGTDDGGKPGRMADGGIDVNQGDWVWSLKPL